MSRVTRLPRALRPFRHRDYRLLIGSMALSLFASGMWIVAVVWQVVAMGGTPSELSVVATAMSVGMLGAILVGGVAADRLSRRALLVVVECVRVVTALAAGCLALLGEPELVPRVGLQGIAIGQGLRNPVRQVGLQPATLVDPGELAQLALRIAAKLLALERQIGPLGVPL